MPPRAAVRQRNATPAKARASTAVPEETPTSRRTTRAASRAPILTKDIVSNPALPEVRLRQSYAYGASTVPILPDQLRAQPKALHDVAEMLESATEQAERNFAAQAAKVRGKTPASVSTSKDDRRSQEPTQPTSPPQPEPTPDAVVKENRTAAWVSDSQLDDIEEEPKQAQSLNPQTETPARHRETSLASSFPSGSFNHSYAYEAGTREPRLPRPNREPSQLRQTPQQHTPEPQRPTVIHRQQPQIPSSRPAVQSSQTGWNVFAAIGNGWTSFKQFFARVFNMIWQWIYRMVQTTVKSISELPDTLAMDWLVKSLVMALIISSSAMLFCTAFTRICDPASPSIITQHLQKICGQCTADSFPTFDLSNENSSDISSLLAALRHTQSQIQQMESRLNSRIDTSLSSYATDAAALRKQQNALELQIRRISQSSSSGSADVSSPLIPKINFFSPSHGAVVIPTLTSPTRARTNTFSKLLLRILALTPTISAPPIEALKSWQDHGDCWCAAEASEQVDSVRLAIQTSQRIYPTEIIVEHFPPSGDLEPGTAPKDLEIWADFSGLSIEEWERIHVRDLIDESPKDFHVSNIRSWARIGTAMYVSERDTTKSHVQRFNLDVNQHGLLHYADRFLVRVKNNHGATYTCLYRVRLHGLPVDTDA